MSTGRTERSLAASAVISHSRSSLGSTLRLVTTFVPPEGHLQDDEASARGVEVVLDGSRGEVEVSRYVQALSDTVWLLTNIDRLAVQETKARLKWTIADTSANGVLRARLTPRTIPDKRPAATMGLPQRALVDGLRALSQRPEIPDLFTEASVQRVDRLGEPTRGVKGVLVAPVTLDGEVGEAVSINDSVRSNAKAAIAPQETSVGSVVGVLDVLNARSKGRVKGSLFNVRTRHAVTCLIASERSAEFVEAFGRRVLIGGPLTRNELGQVISIQVAELQILPDDYRTPTIDELLGIDPDWTGSMSTADYLARVRGA